MSDALGLIETRGLIGAIVAADAALKSANVVLKGTERVDAALVTVLVTGEVAAVQAAVDAGSAAAEKVGELIAKHVIPRPHGDVDVLLEPISGHSPVPGGAITTDSPPPPSEETKPGVTRQYLETTSVTELRRLARQTPGLGMRGREISTANRQDLIQALARILPS